jgi:imidazolonepropionase-like amidohydrolase
MAPGARAQESLLITGGTVVDVRAGTERPGQAILIERGRIVAVGLADSMHPPRAVRRVDARGRWIIPGIIDVHAHTDDRRVLARALALGITGTLDMPRGGDTLMPMERWSRSPASPTPRLALVPWMFSGEWPANLFPGILPVRKPRSAEEAHRFVAQVHRIGGRHLKVYLEDGELWFEPSARIPNLTPEVVSEIVRTAHALGIRVYVHAWKTGFARQAIAAGVDALIHPVADSVLPGEFWQEMRRRNMPWVSTFMAMVAYGDPAGYARRVLADSSLRAVIATDELAQLARDTVSGPCRADVLPVLCRHYDAYMETVRQNTRAARAAGVPLALGSDWSLGVGTHIELELLREAGIPEADVLRAATWGSALALAQSDAVGTIEPGWLADLVVLRADPLLDIRNARRIELVIKEGHVFEPSALLR